MRGLRTALLLSVPLVTNNPKDYRHLLEDGPDVVIAVGLEAGDERLGHLLRRTGRGTFAGFGPFELIPREELLKGGFPLVGRHLDQQHGELVGHHQVRAEELSFRLWIAQVGHDLVDGLGEQGISPDRHLRDPVLFRELLGGLFQGIILIT